MTEIECLVPPVPMAGRCLDQHRKKGKWEGKREKKNVSSLFNRFTYKCREWRIKIFSLHITEKEYKQQ
jgi:hypothetical protein